MTAPDTLQVLIEARKLIEKPENWTQGELARDEGGTSCHPERGVRWCAEGAIQKATGDYYYYDIMKAITGDFALYKFNDTHTHAEVLAAFTRAIEAERARQQGGVT